MARWASVFVLITLFVLALPLMGQTAPPSAPRDVLVKFRAVTAQALEDVVRVHDIEDAKWVGGTGVIKFRSRSQGAAAMVRALSARPDVLYAEPDYIVTRMVTPTDPPLRRSVGDAHDQRPRGLGLYQGLRQCGRGGCGHRN